MALEQRIKLYKDIETARKRPLVIYCTSHRKGANGQIASDVVPEILTQIQKLPKKTKSLDLLVVSEGGDPTVAWRLVSLIRERVENFSVLVPYAAYSAATLIALGADEIVMHPHGNLGPTDPQMSAPKPGPGNSPNDRIQFGSEDMSAFLDYARTELGLSDQKHLLEVFQSFCNEVGSVSIGVAARTSRLSLVMGEKLLSLHMTGDSQKAETRRISEQLNKDFFHHGYPVNRSEAKQIGLHISESNPPLEELMWGIWSDLSNEMEIRKQFDPIEILSGNPESAHLFNPAPLVNIPQGLPDEVLAQVYQQILSKIDVRTSPPTPYSTIHAAVESSRCASRYVSRGLIYGTRLPDMNIRPTVVRRSSSWEDIKLPRREKVPKRRS